MQAGSESAGQISRIAGFGTAASASIFCLLALNGVRGVVTKWWRVLLVLALIPVAAMGGYRTTIVLIGLTLATLFVVEGLLRTAYFPTLLLAGLLSFAMLIPVASYLPNPMQRALSFLPLLKLNPYVRYEAEGSTEWRLLRWKAMQPDLPKYLFLGKGYALNATDLYLAEESVRRQRSPAFYSAIVSGNYHSGPLSVYIPFGGFGSLAFVGFLVMSIRALYLNCRWGIEPLKTLNRFLLAYFVTRVIFFFAAFGSISTDLSAFTGLVGLSVALNRGVCRRPTAPLPSPVRLRGTFDGGSVQPRPA